MSALSKRFTFLLVIACYLLGLTPVAYAQSGNSKSCLRTYYSSPSVRSATTAEETAAANIVAEIAKRLGLSAYLKVIPCSYEKKANSIAPIVEVEDGIPVGEYIIFNPIWIKETAGKDRVQATFIFGHEMGHHLNQHFGARVTLNRSEKELEADRFGACSVARLGGDWQTLEGLVRRLRDEAALEQQSQYPQASDSIEIARKAYFDCLAIAGTGELHDTLAKVIATVREGECPDDLYSALLLATCKNQIGTWKDYTATFGQTKTLEFLRRETFQGTQVEWYRVVFENHELLWAIALDANSKVSVSWSPN